MLFARLCLLAATFCIRTSFVRGDVEDGIRLADTRIEGVDARIVVRVASSIEEAQTEVEIY